MPKWMENDTENRYVYLDLTAFVPGTIFVKEEAKGVFAVRGRVKNEEGNRIQALRFSKSEFTLLEAKAWLEKHQEKIEKFFDSFSLIEKNGLHIQQIHFSKDKFSVDKAREFLATKNLDISNLAEEGSFFVSIVKDIAKFIPNSIRNINFREGIRMTVGLMRQEIKKSYSELDLKADDINELYDMDITEITLTGSPAIGKAGCIQIMKSASAKPEHDFVWSCPIAKVDKVKNRYLVMCKCHSCQMFRGILAPQKKLKRLAMDTCETFLSVNNKVLVQDTSTKYLIQI